MFPFNNRSKRDFEEQLRTAMEFNDEERFPFYSLRSVLEEIGNSTDVYHSLICYKDRFVTALQAAMIDYKDRNAIRLLIEFGVDVEDMEWDRILPLLSMDNTCYPPLLAMFHELTDDYVGTLQAIYCYNEETKVKNLNQIAMNYLNYHGSMIGFPFHQQYLSSPHYLIDPMILRYDLLPPEGRRGIYFYYLQLSFAPTLNLQKALTDVLFLGQEECLTENDKHLPSSLVDPALLLRTIAHDEGGDDVAFIKLLLQEIEYYCTEVIADQPEGIELFQHVVNYALVQSYCHINLIQLLIEQYGANPNVIVPVFHNHVDYRTLNYCYHSSIKPSRGDRSGPLIREEKQQDEYFDSEYAFFKLGDDVFQDKYVLHASRQIEEPFDGYFRGYQRQGYSVLHMLAKMNDKKDNDIKLMINDALTYLFKQCTVVMDPYILNRHLFSPRSTPINLAKRNSTFCLFYVNNVFPRYVNQLVISDDDDDDDSSSDNVLMISPLMWLINQLTKGTIPIHFVRETIQLWIEKYQADVNVKDAEGKTVLMRAVEANNIHAVYLLLNVSNLHDLSIENDEGITLQQLLINGGFIPPMTNQTQEETKKKKKKGSKRKL